MGTYSDSKIRVAGKKHRCGHCQQSILKGDRYLAYKPGLRSTLHVCLPCARSVSLGSGRRYDCADLRREMGLEPDRTRVG